MGQSMRQREDKQIVFLTGRVRYRAQIHVFQAFVVARSIRPCTKACETI
jgi:hypothetical protein